MVLMAVHPLGRSRHRPGRVELANFPRILAGNPLICIANTVARGPFWEPIHYGGHSLNYRAANYPTRHRGTIVAEEMLWCHEV